MATINFSLTGVWLLIDGSYLFEGAAAFINFGAISLANIDIVDTFFWIIFKMYVCKQQNQAKDIFCYVLASN